MKRKYILIPLLTGAVAFTACKEKPTAAAPASDSTDQTEQPTASEKPAPPEAAPIKATATAEARAAKLGFAGKLPKNIVHFEGMYNGRKAFDQFLKSDMGEFLLQRLADEDISLEELMVDEELVAQIASYSEEYFAAYGEGAGKSFDVALQYVERLLYYGARTGVFVGDGFVRDGEDFSPDSPKVFTDGPLKGAPKEVIKMIADFDMPAFYQGSKVSDEDARGAVAAQMEQGIGFLAMFDEAVEPVTITKGDSEFTGFKVVGSKIAEMIDEDTVEEMQEVFDIADIESFKKTLATKSFVVVSGVMDDYVILFVGKSEDDFVLVDNPADSICANPDMAFIDQYIDKDILVASFSDSSLTKNAGNVGALAFRMVGSLAKGLQDGLGDASSLGDTQDVEVLLESLQKQGRQLGSMFHISDVGSVAYLEDGLKFEVFGGSNAPSLDLDKTHTLSSLAAGENTLMFANWVSNKDYNEQLLEYVDTLGETGYLITQRVAGLDIKSNDFAQFKGGVEMFDSSFRKDALNVWQALRGDLAEGLGAEAALVIDVNGALPKVPGVPPTLLKDGKMPRISYISTVDERAKLQSSWTQINTSAESILKTVSSMVGNEIPMQDMMSSEKNGLTTWWTSIPFTGNDFLPCVSVSDELFLASTSKTYSESLSEQFKKGGGDARKGAWMHVDFKVLNQYAGQWLELVTANAEEVFPSESAREDFATNKPMIDKALQAFGSMEDMTLHARNEGGRSRVSFHLKAK